MKKIIGQSGNDEGFLIHVISGKLEQIQKQLKINYFKILIINGAKIKDKQTFFDEFSKSLNFPNYFGNNWDAWDECLWDFVNDLHDDKAAIIWDQFDRSFIADPQTCLQGICDLREIAWKISTEKKDLEIFLIGKWGRKIVDS